MSLIEDAKNKNPDAFEQLIQPQLQRMYRVAISMLHNEEDAADAIQETVLKCWQKIGQLKSEEYFGTWLTRILINQCKNILKERKKVVPLEEFPELIQFKWKVPDCYGTVLCGWVFYQRNCKDATYNRSECP